MLRLTTMESQVKSEVEQWAGALPPGARVIAEGGHFTIQSQLLAAPTALEFQPDAFHLVELRAQDADLPHQIFRGSREEADLDVAIVAVPEGESVPLDSRIGIQRIHVLSFATTATEEQSFRFALDAVVELDRRGQDGVPALFVGDLGLPPKVRQWAHDDFRFLPDRYRQALAERGLEGRLRLFFESYCRNRSKEWILDHYRSLPEEQKDRRYREAGYAIYEEEEIHFLAGHATANVPRFPTIALTKSRRNIPTCPLIMAGKFLKMEQEGFTDLLSFYDRRDDPQIQEKNREGSVIAAYSSTGDFRYTLVTTDVLGSYPAIDRGSARDLRSPGTAASRLDFVDAIRKRTQVTGCQMAADCQAATCGRRPAGPEVAE